MKPTRKQYFLAEGWPLKIYMWTVIIFSVAAAAIACQPSRESFSDPGYISIFVAAVGMALVLGFCLALPSIWIFVGPFYWRQAQRNGAPFSPGDRVRILSRPHRDRITRVYSLWQGETVRVELDEKAREKFADVFHPIELLREPEDQAE